MCVNSKYPSFECSSKIDAILLIFFQAARHFHILPCSIIKICIYPTPPHEQEAMQGQFLSGFSQVWIQSFPFFKTNFHTKIKDPSFPYYLPIARGGTVGFILFPRISILCEIQTALFSIWTLVLMSISYNDNHFTMSAYYQCRFFFIQNQANPWIVQWSCMRILSILFKTALFKVLR